jgi:uncharacterized membrane protein
MATIQHVETEKSGPSLIARALATVVLLFAAWILLKMVIGFVAWVAGMVVLVLAVIAVIWALRVLL